MTGEGEVESIKIDRIIKTRAQTGCEEGWQEAGPAFSAAALRGSFEIELQRRHEREGEEPSERPEKWTLALWKSLSQEGTVAGG